MAKKRRNRRKRGDEIGEKVNFLGEKKMHRCVGPVPPPLPPAGPQQLAAALVICAGTSTGIASCGACGAGPPPPPAVTTQSDSNSTGNTQHTSVGATIESNQQSNQTCGRFGLVRATTTLQTTPLQQEFYDDEQPENDDKVLSSK